MNGQMMICPYGNFDDLMHVIWQDDVFVQDGMWKMFRYRQPTFFDMLPNIIQYHLSINHLSKQIPPPMRTYRDIIRTRQAVIVSFQPNRKTSRRMDILFKIHPN